MVWSSCLPYLTWVSRWIINAVPTLVSLQTNEALDVPNSDASLPLALQHMLFLWAHEPPWTQLSPPLRTIPGLAWGPPSSRPSQSHTVWYSYIRITWGLGKPCLFCTFLLSHPLLQRELVSAAAQDAGKPLEVRTTWTFSDDLHITGTLVWAQPACIVRRGWWSINFN